MLWPDLQTIVETIPNILFLINKKWRSTAMPIIEQLFYQTDKSSHWRCSIEEAAHKNFAIFLGTTCVEVSFGTRPYGLHVY